MTEKNISSKDNEASINRSNPSRNPKLYNQIDFKDFINEQTFFYQNVPKTVTQPITRSLNQLSNNSNINNNLTSYATLTANVTMSLMTSFAQYTILTTLRRVESTQSSTTQHFTTHTQHRYFSPPKKHDHPESEELSDTLNSYKTDELYRTYNPEIGLRIAIALGSMILILLLYLIWHNNCSPSRNLDLDMEFWLNYIDKRKIQSQKKNLKDAYDSTFSFKIPDKKCDSTQTTANWILEHSYLTRDMPTIPNKYYLTELDSRHEKNYKNRELLLFKEKFDFKSSFKERNLSENNLNDTIVINNNLQNDNNTEINSKINKKLTFKIWYHKTFKDSRSNHLKNDKQTNLESVNYELIRQVLMKKNITKRHSWPSCNDDYLQLYNLRYKTLNHNTKNQKKTLQKSRNSIEIV